MKSNYIIRVNGLALYRAPTYAEAVKRAKSIAIRALKDDVKGTVQITEPRSLGGEYILMDFSFSGFGVKIR